MKKLTLFFATTTIALAAVCLVEFRKLGAQRTQTAVLTSEAEQKIKEAESLQLSETRANQQVHELLHQNEELTTQLQTRQQPEAPDTNTVPTNALTGKSAPAAQTGSPESAAGKAGDAKGGFGGMLSKMMEDPQARQMIRQQQRMVLDQMYSPLVKQLGLSSEEGDKFKDLLADNMMKGADKAFSMFGATSNRSEAINSMQTDQKSFDEQVKAFLGEDRYAMYQDYQQTAGERAQLSQFRQMSPDNALTEQQTEQLLAFIKEEKKTAATSFGQNLPGSTPDPANLQAMLSDEQLEKTMNSQATVNDRVYQRASQILSPEQLGAFGKFQTNQIQMMRVGMTMARKLLGPDKPADNGN